MPRKEKRPFGRFFSSDRVARERERDTCVRVCVCVLANIQEGPSPPSPDPSFPPSSSVSQLSSHPNRHHGRQASGHLQGVCSARVCCGPFPWNPESCTQARMAIRPRCDGLGMLAGQLYERQRGPEPRFFMRFPPTQGFFASTAPLGSLGST